MIAVHRCPTRRADFCPHPLTATQQRVAAPTAVRGAGLPGDAEATLGTKGERVPPSQQTPRAHRALLSLRDRNQDRPPRWSGGGRRISAPMAPIASVAVGPLV